MFVSEVSIPVLRKLLTLRKSVQLFLGKLNKRQTKNSSLCSAVCRLRNTDRNNRFFHEQKLPLFFTIVPEKFEIQHIFYEFSCCFPCNFPSSFHFGLNFLLFADILNLNDIMFPTDSAGSTYFPPILRPTGTHSSFYTKLL